jgi:hypothetical protein
VRIAAPAAVRKSVCVAMTANSMAGAPPGTITKGSREPIDPPRAIAAACLRRSKEGRADQLHGHVR